MLGNNRLASLSDLDPLSSLPRLRYLSLLDNPVTKQPGYRLYLIARCKQLKVLDFRKVRQQVRPQSCWDRLRELAASESARVFCRALSFAGH